MLTLISLLVACAPQPAAIKLDGEPTVAVHNLAPIPVETATVLDEAGNKIDPQPKVTWAVTPETVAKLDGDKVVPAANGDATVTATLGTISSAYTVKVSLPDKLAITGYDAAKPLRVGETAPLAATVMAGTDKVEDQTIAWTSDNAAVATVDDKGQITGVSVGTANIKATCGTLESQAAITVAPAAAETADAIK
jgi:uncharacterized protein YjdB